MELTFGDGRHRSASDQDAVRVMLIDDNDALLSVLSDALSGRGFQVRSYLDAPSALNSLKVETPDIIICDVMMPVMDGYEFHDRVRNHPDWAHIPFVFLSALAAPNEVRYGTALGCDDYVTKPVDPLDLIAVVQGKLRRAREHDHWVEYRLDQYRRRIVHTLSHEFRTPLVAINTGAELLLEQYPLLDQERINRLLESVQRGGLRLQRLIDDFMLLQQLDSGVAASAYKRMHSLHSLAHLAHTAVQLFQESSGADSTPLHFESPDGDDAAWSIDVYDIHVIDVIKRVLSNAVKFGGNDRPITVRLQRAATLGDGGQVQMPCVSLVIRDFGPGMSEEALARVGKRFTQIDRDRFEQQGCGLGLSIARCLVELNAGAIQLRPPADGAGLEVEIKFPLVEDYRFASAET